MSGKKSGKPAVFTLQAYWDALESIGWLEGAPEAERQRLRSSLADGFARDPSSSFYLLSVTGFDAECIEGQGPGEPCSYHSVIHQIASASGGAFRPEGVVDELDGDAGVARVSFTQAGRAFRTVVPYEDDWFQEGVLTLVNKAVRATGERRQFIVLPPCDQTVYLVFVKPETYKQAVSAGLIPREPQFGQ